MKKFESKINKAINEWDNAQKMALELYNIYLPDISEVSRMAEQISSISESIQFPYENVKHISQVENQFEKMVSSVAQSQMAYVSLASSIQNMQVVSNSLIPNINSILEMGRVIQEQNQIFQSYLEFYDFISHYDFTGISIFYQDRYFGHYSDKLEKFIRSNHWIVPSISSEEFIIGLIENQDNESFDMDDYYLDFFKFNDYENILKFKEKWDIDDLIPNKKRNIIDKAIDSIVNGNGEEYLEFIIPLMIIQIDSLIPEILFKNDYIPNEKNKKQFIKKEGSTDNPKGAPKTLLNDLGYDLVSNWDSSTYNNLLEILFTSTDTNTSYQLPIPFSRHEIMHGVNYEYAIFENFIRCLLIIDFINDCLSNTAVIRLN